MSGKAKFRFAKTFDRNWKHPRRSSSIHGIGDALRDTGDNIRDAAKSMMTKEAALKASEVRAIRSGELDANAGKPGRGYLRKKAELFALESASRDTFAIMTSSTSGQTVGRVVINRTGSAALEYGGEDIGVTLGQGSKQHPIHPSYAFLRRAADRARV